MPKVTFLGDVDNPNDAYTADAHCCWGGYTFPVDVPVEVTDAHIILKARTNRFFRLEEDEPLEPLEPLEQTSAAAANPAPVKRSHKKKVPPP